MNRVRILRVAEVSEMECWREGLESLAKDHRYYGIVAETLDFDCRALVIDDEDGQPFAAQPCFFVEQDLMATAPRAARRVIGFLRRAFPRLLRLRFLMVGCAAGEGEIAKAALARPGVVGELRRTLAAFARRHGASLIVWKDLPARYRGMLAHLIAPGSGGLQFVRLPSMPATALALNFANFDDYMARQLSHSMRKNLRRKFKVLAGAPPISMTVTNDLGDAADEAFALYLQVFGRSQLQFERLTKEFLQGLAREMPERVRFFLWRQEGRLVAFSLCLVHDGALYDEYLGLDYRVALDLHLYFVTFRDVLSWALAQGLRTYYSTPLNYDPKLHLGFRLEPLDLYVAHPSPLLHGILRRVLPWIQPTRAEPALPRFANAHEMEAGV